MPLRSSTDSGPSSRRAHRRDLPGADISRTCPTAAFDGRGRCSNRVSMTAMPASSGGSNRSAQAVSGHSIERSAFLLAALRNAYLLQVKSPCLVRNAAAPILPPGARRSSSLQAITIITGRSAKRCLISPSRSSRWPSASSARRSAPHTFLASSHHASHRLSRQADREFGEFAQPAVDLDRAAVFLGDDVAADRKTQPGAFAQPRWARPNSLSPSRQLPVSKKGHRQEPWHDSRFRWLARCV